MDLDQSEPEPDYEEVALWNLWLKGNNLDPNNPYRLSYPQFKAWLSKPHKLETTRTSLSPLLPVPNEVQTSLLDHHANSYYWYNATNLGVSLPISSHPHMVRYRVTHTLTTPSLLPLHSCGNSGR